MQVVLIGFRRCDKENTRGHESNICTYTGSISVPTGVITVSDEENGVVTSLSQVRIVPSLSLARVKGIRASPTNNSPFASVDSIYTFVLEQASDSSTIWDILALKHLSYYFPTKETFSLCLNHYYALYTRELVVSCISRLSSILILGDNDNLQFFRAFLLDFLHDQSRCSGVFWTKGALFKENLLIAIWDRHRLKTGSN